MFEELLITQALLSSFSSLFSSQTSLPTGWTFFVTATLVDNKVVSLNVILKLFFYNLASRLKNVLQATNTLYIPKPSQ